MTTKKSGVDKTEQIEAEEALLSMGSTLEHKNFKERFAGVQQNILQEVHSGLCTLPQAVAYLNNFEAWLLEEQDAEQKHLAKAA